MTEETLDLSALDGIFDEFRDQKGALIPVLQRAQDILGHTAVERQEIHEIGRAHV